MSQKYANGAFCFYRTSAACVPMTPAEIEPLAQQHNLPASIVPAYAGDRAQVSRAIAQAKTGLANRGHVLTALTTRDHEVVYRINAIQREDDRGDMPYEARLWWSDEHGNGASIEGTHAVACQVDAAYQGIRGKVCPGDWTASLTAYLVGECYAQPMREDGRIYYLPVESLGKLAPLSAFLAQVGISLVICEIEAEAVPVVQQAASEGLAEQLQALQDAVAAFDGKQKPSNYRARIGEITQLRARATAYRDALGIGVEQAQAVLDQLEAQVHALLDIRENTVVHRTGAVSAIGAPGSQSVDTLAQAFEQPAGVQTAPLKPAFSW